MLPSDVISLIKLLFVKDKELYVFIHRITGYYPHDIKLYQLAMIHRSKPIKTPDGHWTNNERLEYLGDAVLDTVVADFLYKAFPNKHEGLSRLSGPGLQAMPQVHHQPINQEVFRP